MQAQAKLEAQRIGWIDRQTGRVLCDECAIALCAHSADTLCPLFDINILPYSQTCFMCTEHVIWGSVITELFD